MPFTNNNMLTIACASSQSTASNECNDGCDGVSGASFEPEFDFCIEYPSSESESESESEGASTSRSESPDILHEPLHEPQHGSMTSQHLHYCHNNELAPHAPSQAPSRAHARPPVRTRSLTLPATTSTATASRAVSQSAYATAAPPPPPPPPALAAARTADAPGPKRSIYKRRHSYDLRYDFLHAAPAARAALARFHRQIFHAPPPPPSQTPAQAVPPIMSDGGAPSRSHGRSGAETHSGWVIGGTLSV